MLGDEKKNVFLRLQCLPRVMSLFFTHDFNNTSVPSVSYIYCSFQDLKSILTSQDNIDGQSTKTIE